MKQIKFGINGTAVRRTGQFNSVDFDRSGFAWPEKFIFLLVLCMVLWRFAHLGNRNSIGKLLVTQHEIVLICGIKSSETMFWESTR